MEFIQVGDLHLPDISGRGGLSKYVEQPEQMVIQEVQTVVDYAVEHHVRHVILSGDLCEGPRMSYESQLALDDLLTKNQKIHWHLILGNHDMYSLDPSGGHSLQLMARLHHQSPNVSIYTKPTVKTIGGVKVRFLPYPHTSFKRGMLNVFHNEVRGSKRDSGQVIDDPELPISKAVALGGHLHLAHRVRNTWYCGTLYQTNFGESLPKFFHHVEYRSDDDYDVRRINHKPKYVLHNLVIETRSDLETIPQGDTNLVKLVIKDGADVSASDLARFPNVVELRNFKTKEDLASALNEDVSDGQAVTFNVDDFFDVWIEAYDVEDSMREHIRQVRRRVLNSAKTK